MKKGLILGLAAGAAAAAAAVLYFKKKKEDYYYDEEFDEECEYLLVGSTEADPRQNKISDESPVGKALLGHKVGDVVLVEAPAGEIKLKIVGISK